MKTYTTGALLVAVLGFFTVRAVAAGELLPNLEALPPSKMCLTHSSGNTTLLQFEATSWNSGRGPLEVVAQKTIGKKRKIDQRIYRDDGTYRSSLAGFFVWHAAHNHFHVADYAHYIVEPVDAPGASPRIGTKTSFCLGDNAYINSAVSSYYHSCGSPTQSGVIQGLSVGWGDTYHIFTIDQEVDVTGLPDGDYLLKMVVDPKKRLIESDDTDNTGEVLIHLGLGGVPDC